tara:strand:- start:2547 stop:3467 length:921 start_codon:yes stop_codon:yes gene_type:complete
MKSETQEDQYALILGKGFALNVYLPALYLIGYKNIALEVETKSLFNSNIKLNKIKNNIKWINNNEIDKYKFSKIIIAEPPKKQFELICNRNIWKSSHNLILEKPIAENHVRAKTLIDVLSQNKVNFSINYSFRYTKWFKIINKYLKHNFNKGEVTLNWKFLSRHIRKKPPSWKNLHHEGGGAIRFYGIHLIAILSDIGYEEITKTSIIGKKNTNFSFWRCQFKATKNLPILNLFLDCDSKESHFNWKQGNELILELENPFALETSELYNDTRIPLAINFLKQKNSEISIQKNKKVLDLWYKIESKI